MRYFVTIADEGQITRAAQKLYVAQPVLSNAITQLESRLGVELFVRHARGVTLTRAGEAYLVKARAALAALDDAELTAQTLARADSDTVVWGFIGSPPMVEAPDLYATLLAAYPDANVAFRELPYPRETTAAWLREVDVALCYSPTPHPDVVLEQLRAAPRVALLSKRHALAGRRELAVAEVLDETFCGTDGSLEPVRAGFWNLNDHRGGPPAHVSPDRAMNPQETIAVVASGRAISVAPGPNAVNFLNALPGADVVAIPLRDADPTVLSLVWSVHTRNPLVAAIAGAGRSLAHSDHGGGRVARRGRAQRRRSSPADR
jgi:DNA-binding transcriptional LysR family regulator